jgi:hypothetical protein
MAERQTRRGGQELPPNVQDRPEQNAGYDEAVRGADTDPNLGRDELGAMSPPEDLASDDGEGADTVAPDNGTVDDREARGAAADVRRRERKR